MFSGRCWVFDIQQAARLLPEFIDRPKHRLDLSRRQFPIRASRVATSDSAKKIRQQFRSVKCSSL
jgi:hypothetical protein